MKNKICILLLSACTALLLAACSKDSIHGDGFRTAGENIAEAGDRTPTPEQRHVLLLYSAGYNSLRDYLVEDMNDLQQGWLPGSSRNDNILLVYSHLPVKKNAYSTDTSPTLTRIYSDHNGQTVRDTLEIYPSGTRSATAGQLNKVLNDIKQAFPAKSYGMIFSSHATGYLPSEYYSKPGDYVFNSTRSIGQDQVGSYGNYSSYEIELQDFANALPMYLDYILFDACLMGGVEVAYELKGKCGTVGFSQTEVLAEGFDYKTLTKHLLDTDTPDPQAVCEDYFLQYDIQSGVYRSATISLVDCSRMDPLADICRTLFEKYKNNIPFLNPDKIQRYYRYDYHWFYDLEDIIIHAGATEEELALLHEALNECIVYKACTPEFMGSFTIDIYSGLSMYLPCNGSVELDKYYKTLKWNIDTKLVI